jgi:hypothetical protein
MQDLAAADSGAPATQDVTRLSEAAHKLCGLLSAFSTAADLERRSRPEATSTRLGRWSSGWRRWAGN